MCWHEVAHLGAAARRLPSSAVLAWPGDIMGMRTSLTLTPSSCSQLSAGVLPACVGIDTGLVMPPSATLLPLHRSTASHMELTTIDCLQCRGCAHEIPASCSAAQGAWFVHQLSVCHCFCRHNNACSARMVYANVLPFEGGLAWLQAHCKGGCDLSESFPVALAGREVNERCTAALHSME